MADESIKHDPNGVPVAAGLTDNVAREVRNLLVDPTTGRLLVDASISYTGVQDGEAVDAGDYGSLVLGTDGAHYQVLLTDANGRLQVDVISGGGAGVQYTEGDTDATITGNAILWEDTGNTLRVPSTTYPLPISIQSGNISGFATSAKQDTAQASFDLIVASLSVLDDWDETDRLKANIIVGQAGISAGAGAVAANTPRVTHASDDPVVTSLQLIDNMMFADDATAVGQSPYVALFGAVFDNSGTDSVDENDAGYLRMSSNRNLMVTIRDAAGNERGLNVDASGNLILGTGSNTIGALSANQSINLVQLNGNTISLGAGSVAAGTPRVTHASDDPVTVALQLIDDGVYTDDTSTHSTGSSKGYGMMAVATPSDGSVNSNDFGHVAMTTDRKLHVAVMDALPASTNTIGDVDIAPRTTGGWSVANFTSGDTYTALTNSAQVIKGSAGKFGGYYIYNPNATAIYVMVYNIAAASVTVGTSTALLVFCIPALGAANLELIAGIPFGTAMSVAAATTGGGNTAPTTALEAMIFYK